MRRRARRLYLLIRAFPKTLLFNLRYFRLRDALRFPVIVSHRVWLMEMSGQVILHEKRAGVVRIGFGEVGIFDQHRSRSIWQVSGRVEFLGNAELGHGTRLSVCGDLVLGRNFCTTAESAIIVHKRVTMGSDVLISWGSQIMDTDFHDILDCNNVVTNRPADVAIGNRVWIGCRSLVLKGVSIADGVVIAAASTVTHSIDTPNVIAGGSPARVIREDIRWSA